MPLKKWKLRQRRRRAINLRDELAEEMVYFGGCDRTDSQFCMLQTCHTVIVAWKFDEWSTKVFWWKPCLRQWVHIFPWHISEDSSILARKTGLLIRVCCEAKSGEKSVCDCWYSFWDKGSSQLFFCPVRSVLCRGRFQSPVSRHSGLCNLGEWRTGSGQDKGGVHQRTDEACASLQIWWSVCWHGLHFQGSIAVECQQFLCLTVQWQCQWSSNEVWERPPLFEVGLRKLCEYFFFFNVWVNKQHSLLVICTLYHSMPTY